MKEMPLTRGKFAIVDDEDFEYLNQWKWYYHHRGYAYGGGPPANFMHRIIMRTPKGMDTDHRDGNGLNNQKSNLRICSHSENLCNRGKQKDNTTGFKGVYWIKSENKWRASIFVMGKYIWLGRFLDLIDAVRAYDTAAKKYHGEFAKTNF